MSVLNKMLRDLEQRQPTSASGATSSIAATSGRPLWLNALFVLCIILLGVASYIVLTPAQRPTNTEPAQQALVVTATPAPVQIAPEIEADTAVALGGDIAAELPSRLPDNTQVQAIAEILAAAPDVEPRVIKVNAASKPVVAESITQPPRQPLQSDDVQNSAPAKTATVPGNAAVQVERTIATVQQRAAALQQQALVETQAGRLQQALQYWLQVQQLTPNAEAVYLAQARLWVQLGQAAQAEQVLQQGLAQGIVSADIQLLLAQNAAAQAQWQQVDALLPANFELTQQPQYYGLKATALQQLGQQQAALRWFNQLIVAQPQQARWWLGAAIAYDALANREQAHLHYRQAQQWGDSLSVASRNYIQQRLAATE